MKKKLRIFIGGILVVVGCGFFLYPNFREIRTQNEVEQIIETFNKQYNQDNHSKNMHDSVSSNNDSAGDSATTLEKPSAKQEDYDKRALVDDKNQSKLKPLYDEMRQYNNHLIEYGQNIVDAWSYEQQPITLSLLDADSPVIGYIEIPDMKIRLPLLLGASPENLQRGASVLSETSMPIGGENTNCVIAGHRGWEGSAYFQYIENMQQGSKVYVTNPWETLVYECVSTQVISPDDVNSILIQPGKDMLTLFTCHPYRLGGGPYRYLVFCERVDTLKDSDKKQEIVNPHTEPQTEQTKATNNNQRTQTEKTSISQSHIAQIQSEEGINLLFLEKKLRYILPIMVIIASIMIILFRILGDKSSHTKSQTKNKNHINKKNKKRRTLI